MEIEVREPFDWERTLDFIGRFPATKGEQSISGSTLTKAWRFGGRTVVTDIRPGRKGAVEVDVDGGPEEEVRDRLNFFLSLDDDLTGFYAKAREDRPFADVVTKLHGYHQVKFASPLENVVWAILSQRNPLPVARAAKMRLMEKLNSPVREIVPFPSLDQLESLSRAELGELIGNERKAGYLHGTIHRLGEVDEEFLRHGSLHEVREFLLSLPGIGPWSATFVLIRGLGRMELLPDDAETQNSVDRVYGPGHDPAKLAQRYEPVPGLWAHYLRVGS